ncbi:hypothetical protein V5N11_012819 [Cardamine amara subsp. amara]|uniref:Tf2-1-like SH3-like domain-containing protein n=1 Tax=Cardamine amara subsp. amara TaxID=228776 RepID=A0ABD1BCL6_CARAN
MKEAHDRQKSYADRRKKELEFAVGDLVYLKMAMLRGPNRSISGTKLSPRYMGPVRVLDVVGLVAYRLELPDSMQTFHKVFHVSMLKKCLHKDDQVVTEVPSDLTPSMVEARPLSVLDHRVRVIRRKKV